MGRLIGMLDRDWNRESLSHTQRRLTGVAALVMLILIVGIASYVIERSLLLLPLGMVAVALAASTLIAQRSLYEHVARVASALESGDLETAREAVSHIVGRDTADLDEAGVARAAIESLAENFSDGVVAPVFWMLLGGLPGAAIYKAINTADSMIGHRTARHQDFGWASARLDDLVNLPASRLSVLLIAAAARIDSADAAGEAIGTATPRCRQARLAECGLSGSGDGRRARLGPRWPALLWRRPGRQRRMDRRGAQRRDRRRHPRRA